MAQFNIVHIQTNDHAEMYRELIDSLSGALVDLGHECSVTVNLWKPDTINILLGSTIFASRHLELPKRLTGLPYLVFQLELLHDRLGLLKDWPEYVEVLKGAAAIWSYADTSTRFLAAKGFANLATVPPGYHRTLDTFRPNPVSEIDVLFTGTDHPRRGKVLRELFKRGVNAFHLVKPYGAPRNAHIARARIVINIHAWDDLDNLETIRLALLLANRCFVISEKADHNPFGDGVVFADYDQLVETCIDWLARPAAERDAVAARGQAIFRAQEMAVGLREALAQLPKVPLTATVA